EQTSPPPQRNMLSCAADVRRARRARGGHRCHRGQGAAREELRPLSFPRGNRREPAAASAAVARGLSQISHRSAGGGVRRRHGLAPSRHAADPVLRRSGRRHPQLSRQHHRRRPIQPAAGDNSGRDAALSHGGSVDFTLRRAMQLQSIDWLIVVVYGVASLIIGVLFTKRAGRSLEQYFLSGRKLPWWLLGTSMV